ncbi:F-box domain-containing protein [Pleurotus pulmonarius]|nr:hypothetical protein EYR38_006271 [Pleurotus pulmonarius]
MQSSLAQRSFDFMFPFHKCATFQLSLLPSRQQATQTLPLLPDEIWLEIFEFATYLHHAKTIAPLPAFTPARISTNAMAANTPYLTMRTKNALVLVCKSWRRIALRLLFEHISIPSLRRAKLVFNVLRNSCETDSAHLGYRYGQWTRHLEIFSHGRGTVDYLRVIFEIMKLCPNINHLTGHWDVSLPSEFLDAMPKLYGPSLKGLRWSDDKVPEAVSTPAFLSSFSSLRILDLRNFYGNDESVFKPRGDLPSLPHMQTLILSSRERSATVASLLVLPAVENLVIEVLSSRGNGLVGFAQGLAKMLSIFGKTLVSVDILPPVNPSEQSDEGQAQLDPSLFLQPGVCPNLHSLTFPQSSPQCAQHVHPNLRRIGIRGIKGDYMYPNKASSTKTHLMSISRELYPKLEIVRTIGFLVDSCGDSLMKDIFIWWAERFEDQGIDLQDGEGVVYLYTEPEPEDSPDIQMEVAIAGQA